MIVIGLLMILMGLRSGLLIGGILLLDILGTFIYMNAADVSLQRISLGALIIALGMLVDNAIVVTEGLLVRFQRGLDRLESTRKTVAETMWPLIGATVVAILAFAAISVSDDASGEYLASLFKVVAASLLLSWILAVTVTPLLGILFLRASKPDQAKHPYDRPFFRVYRRFLARAIRRRWFTLGGLVALLLVAIFGFGLVKQSFFPDSGQPQFYIDFWRPEGTDIRDTAEDARTATEWFLAQEGVESVASFVGHGGSRFMITYSPEMPSSAYAQLLITVDDAERIDDLKVKSIAFLADRFPDAEPQVHRFVFGTGGGAKIEARFKGDDPEVLRGLAEQVKAIIRADANAKDVPDDWRQRVPVIRPEFAEVEARQFGVSRSDLAASLQVVTSGAVAGLYREGDTLLPIVFRLPEEERSTVDQLANAQVWSSTTGRMVPVDQVVTAMETEWEDPIIRRYDRRRTITVKSDPSHGVATPVFARLRPQIEAIALPPGYELEWGGEYESSGDANRMLMASVPLFLSLMVLIVVALFNTIRQPLIVFLTVPLAIIGVTAGLLVTGQPFGFVALLGFLSLSGMLIKNSVVLLDQIDLNLETGQEPFAAVLEAGVSRLRPVSMAAFTTVLGMTPLVFDIFWRGMAVTIMAGLTFATVLTLIVVPVLYAAFYRVRSPARGSFVIIENRSEMSRRGRWFLVLTGLGLLLAPRAVSAQASDRRPVARIGIVSDGPNLRQDNFESLMRQEMRQVAADAYEIEFPADAVVDGGWAAASTRPGRRPAAVPVAPEGIGVELVAVDGTNPSVVDELPTGVDAVYLMPLVQLDDEALTRLAGHLTERGLPTFSMLGEPEVDRGVLAGMNTRATMAAFARGAALDVLDLLEGRGGKWAIPARPGGQLTLNVATARALGLSPSWKLRTMARLLHDEGSRGDRPMDLATAIARAVEANLDLAVRQRRVAAGAEDVREARSAYRPRQEVTLAGVAIDDEHAIPALGQYARYAAGSLTLTQLIYSDAATANLAIRKDLQAAREHDWQALRLDIGRAAVAAYTGVLRTGALIRVRKQQVDLTRIQSRAGSAAAIPGGRRGLRGAPLGGRAGHGPGRRAGSPVLPPIERAPAQPAAERAAHDPVGRAAARAPGGSRRTRRRRRGGAARIPGRLRSTAHQPGGRSPGDGARDRGAGGRDLRPGTGLRGGSARRLPAHVGVDAKLNEIVAKDTDRGLTLGAFEDLIGESEDTSWQIGLQASLPIATGGANKARRVRASEELSALWIDHHNTREKLAQRALAALDAATASW